MGLVRKVLVHAARSKFIQSLPESPKVGVQDNARGWFNTKEIRKVWNAAQSYLGKTIEARKYKDADGNTQTQYIDTTASADAKLGELMRKVGMTEGMRRLIVFMTNSYIRPTGIRRVNRAATGKQVEAIQDFTKDDSAFDLCNCQGLLLADFSDAFARYLGPVE